MKEGIINIFKSAMQSKYISQDSTLIERFKVFCFKHDLEALILASKESLKRYLHTDQICVTWYIPVEDQNHEKPPKYIVEDLFRKYGMNYNAKHDAPYICWMNEYQDIANECKQCFKPFVDFLINLPEND